MTFGETPGVGSGETFPMGKGPTIGIGPNLHPGIARRLKEAAEELELPFALEPLPGNSGTDAWAIQVTQEGIPTGLISVPVRYMHSTVETLVTDDLDRAARLLAAFIARLDEKTLEGLTDDLQ